MKKSITSKNAGKTSAAESAVELKQTSEASVRAQTESQGEVALNVAEEMKLEQCENVIKQGLGGFMLAGKALQAIRDEKLYRAKFTTFEDYCRKRWDLSDKYAYRLIDAYTVAMRLQGELKTSPNGEIRLPTNESQVRPLVSVVPDKQIKAWQQVLKNCKGKPITADEVKAVVDKMGGKAPTTQTTKPKTSLKKADTKLVKIGKLVTDALDEEESNLTVPKLKQILEKIRELIESKK